MGHPVAAAQEHWIRSRVLEQHPELAPIVRIDGSRGVGNGDPVPGCEARTRSHLAFDARRKLEDEAGPHRANLPGCEVEVGICAPHVVAGRLAAGAFRER